MKKLNLKKSFNDERDGVGIPANFHLRNLNPTDFNPGPGKLDQI